MCRAVLEILYGLTPIFNATLGASLAARIAISVVLLAPFGLRPARALTSDGL